MTQPAIWSLFAFACGCATLLWARSISRNRYLYYICACPVGVVCLISFLVLKVVRHMGSENVLGLLRVIEGISIVVSITALNHSKLFEMVEWKFFGMVAFLLIIWMGCFMGVKFVQIYLLHGNGRVKGVVAGFVRRLLLSSASVAIILSCCMHCRHRLLCVVGTCCYLWILQQHETLMQVLRTQLNF